VGGSEKTKRPEGAVGGAGESANFRGDNRHAHFNAVEVLTIGGKTNPSVHSGLSGRGRGRATHPYRTMAPVIAVSGPPLKKRGGEQAWGSGRGGGRTGD